MKSGVPALFEPLRTRWRRIRRSFDGRLPSERRLMVVAAVALALAVGDALVFTPAFDSIKGALTRLRESETTLASLQQQVQTRQREQERLKVMIKDELDKIKERLSQQRAAFDQAQEVLVPASEMRDVLEGLLARQSRLKLLSVRTLDRETLALPQPADAAPSVLYRHGLEVKVGGGFHDLLNWLLSVEDLPRQLLWDSLLLGADDQGRLELTIRVHTLSRDAKALELSR